jgi:exosortase D (VPLPA-CTERM-specific)
MSGVAAAGSPTVHALTPAQWGLGLLALAAGYFAFRTGIDFSANWIWTRPEYSHGIIIPFVAAFLVWQRRDELERESFPGAWGGVAVLTVAAAINLIGGFASLFIVQQYAAVLALYGLVLALVGWRVFRRLAVPLLILVLMIPLPEFLYQNLSAQLQLISSQIGVAVIRMCHISVYLEGNVIDLGAMQLQVAEACSGLRYLFPLMTLGFIMAYFFQAALWKRVLLFLSSIPVTILMNSVRIGLIGVTVEYWGLAAAEGFLHDFEGWVVFMASTGVLLLEIIVLSRIGRDRRPWREVFGLEFPAPTPAGATITPRSLPRSFLAAVALLVVVSIAGQLVPNVKPVIPERKTFVEYPMTVGDWRGRRMPLESDVRDVLQLDDYLLADFVAPEGQPVNLYVAWYDTQQAGRSAHSPRSCLPAGGWEFESFTQIDLPEVRLAGHRLRVNRAIIRQGNERLLVYYFFKQRNRILTNEYLVKWYLFWDALTQRRTDGALVRLSVGVRDAESLAAAESRLRGFAVLAAAELGAQLPD